MGGGAFAQASAPGEPTLSTPRMSPEMYSKLKAVYLERLRTFFPPMTQLSSLTEAPEKQSYGDMDLLVALDTRISFIDLANHLGAVGIICHSNQKATLAVPRDGSRNTKPALVYKFIYANNSSTNTAPPSTPPLSEVEYAQLDIELVSPHLYPWHTFYASYGDLAGLLGHIVHALGFTISTTGLSLRMRELDASKNPSHPANVPDREGRILLSHDPDKVMRFLGLDAEVYAQGFGTLEAFYAWVAGCRVLMWDAVKEKRDTASGRSKEAKRTVFSGFFNEWLPAHCAEARAERAGVVGNAVRGDTVVSETGSRDAGAAAVLGNAACVAIPASKWSSSADEAARASEEGVCLNPSALVIGPQEGESAALLAKKNAAGVTNPTPALPITPAHNKAQPAAQSPFRTDTATPNPSSLPSASEQEAVVNTAVRANIAARRAALLHESLAFFAKGAEYEAKHTALVQFTRTAVVALLLKGVLAVDTGKSDKGLNEVARALKRFVGVSESGSESGGVELVVLGGQGRGEGQSELWRLLEVGGEGAGEGVGGRLRDESAVSGWVREHWEEVRGLERKRVKASSGGEGLT
ncbi:hypothetical protein LTR08_007348 [Meristemomyces frigidus]|nr:hypothetical protein LTR08_007348 [Meristemomyces frigidus]